MLFLTLSLIFLIGILGYILNVVFYSKVSNPRLSMLSLYNSYTQFSYLMLVYVFVYTFANDFSKGINIFMEQIGYSVKKVISAKVLVLSIIIIPLVDVIFLVMNFVYGNTDFKYLLLLILIVDLGLIFIISLSIVLSLFLKKTMPATLTLYGLYIIFNILNLFLYGATNPADGNSFSTYILHKLIGVSSGNSYLDKLNVPIETWGVFFAIAIPSIWIALLAILISAKLRKKV